MLRECCATPDLANGVAVAPQAEDPQTEDSQLEDRQEDNRQAEDGGAGEQERLQGTWFAVMTFRNGQGADYFNGNRLTFSGNRFAIHSDEGELLFEGTCRVNPAADPAQIDFAHDGENQTGTTWQGVYVLNGNTLRICDNAPNPRADRPRQLGAGVGTHYVYFVFRRK